MSGAYWGKKVDFDGRRIGKDFFRKIGQIASAIGQRLKKRGIVVTDWKEKYGAVRVYCVVRDDQIKIYQQVYAWACKKYPWYKKYILNGADFSEYLVHLEKDKKKRAAMVGGLVTVRQIGGS